MEVRRAITTQRAVRRFDPDRPIDDATVEQLLDAARRAPSSKNSQPWAFVVVRDRELLRRLATVGPYAGHLADATLAIALVTAETTPAHHAAELYDLGHATQNLMLAATELGIGSVHAAVYDGALVRDLLGLPADRRCDYLVSLGFPAKAGLLDGPRRRVPREPLEDLVHRDRW